ncbi:MAG TPA: histidine kinase [Gammaproteobacteria bacterium]|nr:histidine kinase [Gammaproteobacteria bacterium]
MRTFPRGYVDKAFAPRATRPPSGPLLLAAFQLAFWSLFALLFFLTVRPYHLFADILLGQAAATAALGLAASTVVERLYTLLQGRGASAITAAGCALAGSVLLGLAWYALAAWAGDLIDPFEGVRMPVPGGVLFAPAQLPLYPAVLLLWSFLFLTAARWQDQHAQRERLLRSEALAHEARLRMLRYQLNPHFLFNALNSIGALAGEAPGRVQRMVGELSDFLRYSLLDAERLEVLLRDELRAVTHYLEVEKVRFEEDLDVRIELEPEAARRPLPAFLVLPLVENAIKHGRRMSALPLRIEVTARIVNGSSLQIEVKNTGAWITASQPTPAGTDTGLHNVRERLREHYAGRHVFDVYENDGWVHARIRIDHER